MLPGINEDIVRGARTYHLQTEDRGESNPEVISVLFLGGAVLTTERKSYKEIMEHPERVRGVKKLMIRQHRDVLRRILEGEFDDFEVARRSMTEMEPLMLEPDSVPDLDVVAAEAVALAKSEMEAVGAPGSGDSAERAGVTAGEEVGSSGDPEETIVPGQGGEDLAASRAAAQNVLEAEAQAALTPVGDGEETVDVFPESAAWGSDESWPATGFGHDVITERPFDLVIALQLQAMDDASQDGARQ